MLCDAQQVVTMKEAGGAPFAAQQPAREFTPDDLWDGIIAGDLKAVMMIVESSPGLIATVGAEDQTPLHLACDVAARDEGDECIAYLVQKGADVHAQDTSLRTPLLVACEVGALASARFLMLNTESSLKVTDQNGMSPVHWLAMHGAAELLALGLKKGCDVDAATSSQQTPLHIAISRGHLACALVLLDAGASPAALDEERRCAMHLAMQYSGGMGACSESTLLLLRLLQLDPSLVTAVDADKRTALHWACGKNALPCVRALIKSGAAVDAADWAGRTPVHWAVLVDAAESAQELIQAGAQPSIADRDQRTPLHWAADRASEACVKLLLSAGLSDTIDLADWGGYTALHYAARRGAIGCVKALLAHGASRRLVAMNGELPTDLTSCETTKVLLMETVGMKRQRSLSSANSLVLCSVLPDLAKQFYDAWQLGDVEAYLTPDLRKADAPKAVVLRGLMRKHRKISIAELHVCPKANKVVVELTSGATSGEAAAQAMHSLTFTDEGLVSNFVPYCMQSELAAQ